MRRTIRFLASLLAVLGLTVGLSACGNPSLAAQDVLQADRKSQTMTWGVRADIRLFGLLDTRDNQIKGFEIDLAKAITKQILGPKGRAKFVQVTSATRMPMLENGDVDAIMATVTKTPERAKMVAFSSTYFNAGQSLLVKKGSSIKNIHDLNAQHGTILGVVGANSVEKVLAIAPQAKGLQLTDYAQAMTALKSGQGQALTTDNGILYGLSLQNPGYVVTGGTFVAEPYGIAMAKQQQPLKRAVDQALVTLRQDGEYQRLINKWFHNVKGFDYEEAAHQ